MHFAFAVIVLSLLSLKARASTPNETQDFLAPCCFSLQGTIRFRQLKFAEEEPPYCESRDNNVSSDHALTKAPTEGSSKGFSAPEYVRSWTEYRPYFYRAEPDPKAVDPKASAATVAALEAAQECGFLALIHGRDFHSRRRWRWTWSWQWYFFKKQFEKQARFFKLLLMTPQASQLSGCLYTQIREVASLLSQALASNTEPVPAEATNLDPAEANTSAPMLQGTGFFKGCKRVHIYLHSACHGSIIARALLATDDRIWKGQGAPAAAAGEATEKLQRLLRSPFFSLTSATFTVPALAGVRLVPRLPEAAEHLGPTITAAVSTAEMAHRLLRPDMPAPTLLAWGGASKFVYIHHDPALLLCSLAAAETQRDGSLLPHFRRVAVFSTLTGDMAISPRSAAGVSDEFKTSVSATELLQQAALASVITFPQSAAAAVEADAADTPVALLPHRLPVELAPLNQHAAVQPMPDDIEQLLFNRAVCRSYQGHRRRGHKTYELSLQLLQLWGVFDWQSQQANFKRRSSPEFALRGAQKHHERHQPLVPDAMQLPQQQILRFVVYIPKLPNQRDFSNNPHFIAFGTRTWMLPAAVPTLRAVATAAVGSLEELEQVTVMEADGTWWHH
ncbi:hypothetical protein cyc_02097 [Cyclospora cayetanensis]|uniref:Transmembrane protein n=1 Tax=Cyclospora cayetanensis TaxID=88456 RepID=A0A1D3CWP0_9EIME|nr:hypothetical protein cyc_02097 [Cyclospora cayetanensis]